MMKFTAAFTMMALSGLVSVLTACGQGSNTISTSADAPGAGALGANVDIKNCQVGQSYSSQYGCLNRVQCSYGSGLSTQTGSCVPGQLVTAQQKFGTASPGTRHYARLTVTNSQQFEVMLQAAGLCNSSYGGYGASYIGSSTTRCAQWITQGTFALVESYTGSVDNINIMIGAGTTFPTDLISVLPGVYASYGLPMNTQTYGATNYISFNQQAHNYPFNNNNGMQLTGVSQGRPISFMILVNNGNLGLDNLDAQLVYQGTQIATMKLVRLTNY